MGTNKGTYTRMALIPHPIPDEWVPDVKVRLLMNLEGIDIESLSREFVEFCKKKRLLRAQWGRTFLTWFNKRDKFVPKIHTDRAD